MTGIEQRNRVFLRDLFAGPFPGHGIIVTSPDFRSTGAGGDFVISDRPVGEWVPQATESYECQVRYLEALGDDSVPYVTALNTNTGVFAAAFGCPVHVYEKDTPAAATPIVSTAEEADGLPDPDLSAPTLARVFELAALMRKELGPDAPLGVPDIQSPFDIAALIWNKQDFFVALHEEPDAVKRLVDKCGRLLKRFLIEFKNEFPECNLCHCPVGWAPPELGCWLSEDEVGSLSPAMFDEFCRPWLVSLSETFGGIFIHCCAQADHQYPGFKKIPNLRGLNRVFQKPGPRPAIEAFAGTTVLIQGWENEESINRMLDMALPETRFLFNLHGCSLEEAKPLYERLRTRCPRGDRVETEKDEKPLLA